MSGSREGASRATANVTVSVGRLVFEGLSRSAAEHAGAALRERLADLIEARGLPSRDVAEAARKAPPIRLRPGMRAAEIGRKVAERVWSELAR